MNKPEFHLIGECNVKGIYYNDTESGIEVTLIKKDAKGNIGVLMNEARKIVNHFTKKRG